MLLETRFDFYCPFSPKFFYSFKTVFRFFYLFLVEWKAYGIHCILCKFTSLNLRKWFLFRILGFLSIFKKRFLLFYIKNNCAFFKLFDFVISMRKQKKMRKSKDLSPKRFALFVDVLFRKIFHRTHFCSAAFDKNNMYGNATPSGVLSSIWLSFGKQNNQIKLKT